MLHEQHPKEVSESSTTTGDADMEEERAYMRLSYRPRVFGKISGKRFWNSCFLRFYCNPSQAKQYALHTTIITIVIMFVHFSVFCKCDPSEFLNPCGHGFSLTTPF